MKRTPGTRAGGGAGGRAGGGAGGQAVPMGGARGARGRRRTGGPRAAAGAGAAAPSSPAVSRADVVSTSCVCTRDNLFGKLVRATEVALLGDRFFRVLITLGDLALRALTQRPFALGVVARRRRGCGPLRREPRCRMGGKDRKRGELFRESLKHSCCGLEFCKCKDKRDDHDTLRVRRRAALCQHPRQSLVNFRELPP